MLSSAKAEDRHFTPFLIRHATAPNGLSNALIWPKVGYTSIAYAQQPRQTFFPCHRHPARQITQGPVGTAIPRDARKSSLAVGPHPHPSAQARRGPRGRGAPWIASDPSIAIEIP
jgi:hypothetical protein